MNTETRILSRLSVATIALAALCLAGGEARAHCDAENGPVATDARKALETGRFETVAIWVGADQSAELRASFERSLPVYRMGDEAKELAERHFMEAAVRLHRQAEGFPYTGLKPARPLPPDVAVAERALKTGDLSPVARLLNTELEKRLSAVFREAREAGNKREKSLAAGRAWADAYVKYIIYVHGLYTTIQAGPEHGVGE